MRMFPDAVLYAPEGSEAPNLIETISTKERLALFGERDGAAMPFWPDDAGWQLHNTRALGALQRNAERGDIVMISGGYSQRQIADTLSGSLVVCEPFVGYPGIHTGMCAFESHAWRQHVYGTKQIDGRWYDTVIPNYFDPDEFDAGDPIVGDYLLFVGRVTQRKGPHVAAAIAQAAGMKFVVAGPGVTSFKDGRIVADHVEFNADEYVGVLDIKARAKLMREARAVIVPTVYVEPFGGVAVEAMMAGTPVITSDWGAFTETVDVGVTGYRFSLLQEAVDQVEMCAGLNPLSVRDRGRRRFSLEAVKPRFEKWFEQLSTLYDVGWHMLKEPAGVRG